MFRAMSHDRFHGRISGANRGCERPGCPEQGEFRAPGYRSGGFDGPGDYRWFCLDHVREFNVGFDWFAGMTTEEILRAQSPVAGWEPETRAFRPTAGIDGAPPGADFADPLDAISARARGHRSSRQHETPANRRFSSEERRALELMGLGADADRPALRRRYTELVRRYHPDRNGGDRSHETRLRRVVEAYQLLKSCAAFA